ncbi:MATE family efflux transporter [Fusibacter sp. JL216-2]|uniref:MATE family efflux transporter n=1 Tax=Fusibacter sp. JL216-2 TaxID=3071453 RepID=UPI003D347BC6
MRQSLTEGNISKTLLNLSGPMVLGMLGLIIFNLVDTYFVSLLGTTELVAISFTFPVVLVVNSIALGIGQGTASVVSRAAGAKDKTKLVRYATESLTLGVMVVLCFVLIGLLTIEPLFTALGADAQVMPYIKSYMEVWYLGMVFVVIPMVGNNSIRALGDTKSPSLVMVVAAVANSILDPMFIFGMGPIPAMGVRGAAIATVLSRCITFSVALYILVVREKIVTFSYVPLSERYRAWKDILYIGVPNALTKIIQPLGIGVITRLLATEGLYAVAGYGVASKVERFALIFIMSLAVVMTPFVGQNFGAGKLDRVKKGINVSIKLALWSSLVVYIVLFIAGGHIGAIYSDDPQVIEALVFYLRTVPLFYGAYGIIQITMSVLNAINRPFQAALISLTLMFVIYIPLASVSRTVWGYQGIFLALALSYFVVAIISLFWLKRTIAHVYKI